MYAFPLIFVMNQDIELPFFLLIHVHRVGQREVYYETLFQPTLCGDDLIRHE